MDHALSEDKPTTVVTVELQCKNLAFISKKKKNLSLKID